MVRGLVRAALYLPRFTDGEHRLGGFDEDAFTFAAAALERASGGEAWAEPGPWIRVVGAHVEPALLGAVVGNSVRPASLASGTSSLREAIHAAASDEGPELVVVLGRAERTPEGRPVGAPGEGAAVLLLEERAGALPLDQLPWAEHDPAGIGPLEQLFSLSRGRPRRDLWVGDWDADPTSGPRAPSRVGPRPDVGYTVSQGAYVPQARYEESRPSHWRFVADRCTRCGRRTFPARGRCGSCGSTTGLSPETLPRDGATVVASTWIGPGGQPTEFDFQVETVGPYGVVLAELAPDARVTLAVTDARPDEVRVGSKVDTVLRRLYPIEGSWRYGRKAVPAGPGPRAGGPRSGGP